MATTTSKVQWITTAFAVAAAATLLPVAFADPTDSDASDSGSASVGSSAGQAPSRSSRTNRERPKTTIGTPQAGNSDSAAGSSSSTNGAGSGSTAQSSGGGRASTDLSTPSADATTPSDDVTTPSANATAPLAVGDEVTIIEVPLVADPDLQDATFGWMQNLNIDACVLGLSQRITGSQSVIGPYATSSVSYNSSGCG